MYLKKARWAEGLEPSTTSTVAGELVCSLKRERLRREVTLSLRTGLREAQAHFSFLRLRGLRNLLKFLASVSESEPMIQLFQDSQTYRDLQVVPVLFQHTLIPSKGDVVYNLDHIYNVEPLQITSPAIDCEVALALRVLEGCCLLHKEGRTLAHQHKAMKVLIRILSTGGQLERAACLDAIISIMLDSPANMMDYEAYSGTEKVAELIKDKQLEDNIRLKCGEFLLLLVGHVLPSANRNAVNKDSPNVWQKAPLASTQEDLRYLLGEECASLIWAASQFGSSLDNEQRQSALHIHARRVLDSLDLY
ncbi:hypothetical protein AMTRI_Chr09g39890 [Amborella trichopoda]